MAVNRLLIGLVAALALAGCATGPLSRATLDNAPVCELGRVRAYVVSMVGWMGLAFRLTDESAAVICAAPAVTSRKAPPP
jgi:hypothetical protein